MMKEPTKSAISANVNRNVLKIEMSCWKAVWLSLVNSSPVMASVSAGSTWATRSVSSSCETPSSPATEIQSNFPGSWSRPWSVAVSKRAVWAPPQVSRSPNLAMPTSSNDRVPCWSATSTRSPSTNSPSLADLASSTIWSGPFGGAPSTVHPLSAGDVSQFSPKLGAPVAGASGSPVLSRTRI